MNNTFPRIITLLRKEKGLSQKQAATDLGISQALLSHYEKGIRECGLDFVVRVADYYDVSCDYLLGRTADKSGTTIALDAIPETTDSLFSGGPEASPVLSKKLILNSLHILFDILQKCDNRGVSAEASAMLTLSVYAVFRHIYAANPRNLRALFSVSDTMFRAATVSEIVMSSARLTALCGGQPCRDYEPLNAADAPLILPDNLSREYPLFASSLFNLLKNAESLIDDM
ncbi:MAG: helix-turn-helix transcriptional regulator [Clostridia bacterium]|nr:helix-turn-helix transcriptional regulator [Clostridia bacterium]